MNLLCAKKSFFLCKSNECLTCLYKLLLKNERERERKTRKIFIYIPFSFINYCVAYYTFLFAYLFIKSSEFFASNLFLSGVKTQTKSVIWKHSFSCLFSFLFFERIMIWFESFMRKRNLFTCINRRSSEDEVLRWFYFARCIWFNNKAKGCWFICWKFHFLCMTFVGKMIFTEMPVTKE